MKSRNLKSTLIAVFGVAVATPSEAATVNIQQNVDLATTTISGGPPYTLYQDFSSVMPATIVSGDTVNLTFNFLNGRLMTANWSAIPSGFDYIIPGLVLPGLAGGTFGISNIQISFLDAATTGGAETQFSLGSQMQLNVQAGLSPALVNFLPSGSSLTFSGIQTSYTVDFIYGGPGIYRPYLLVEADQMSVTSIPEPSAHVFAAFLSLLMGGRFLRRTR